MCKGCNVTACRWSKDRTFHFSLLWCRKRKWFNGKLDPNAFEYEPLSEMVLPKRRTVYVIALSEDCKFKKLVQQILSFVESLQ